MNETRTEQQNRAGRRVAMVTGVSRNQGIGAAIADELARKGINLLLTGWSPHDATQPWGEDPGAVEAILGKARGLGVRAEYIEADLMDPAVPAALMKEAVSRLGRVDVLVANHARSDSCDVLTTSAEELDAQWAVNVRSTLLLIQAMAKQSEKPSSGRVVLLTSGQHLGPMTGEIGYVATKGALHQLTSTLAAELAPLDMTVNAVNPGPTATGWASDEIYEAVAKRNPRGRWGTPADAARLISWLVSDEAEWVTGQVINSDGGFS